MSILELQVDALMRLCTAETEYDRALAREDVLKMLGGRSFRQISTDPEYLIRALLLELGAPDHLVGHPYVVQAVLMVVENRNYIDSITLSLYPQLAAKFETTPSRVERAIRHLVEVTWTRGDWEVLTRYFGNTVSAEKGKPTNGEFLARLANVVKLRMREAA